MNFAPIRRPALPGALLLAIAVMVALLSGLTAAPARAAGSAGAEASLVSALNASRASAGLPALAISRDLVVAARAQATRQAQDGRMYHTVDLGSAVTGWRAVGENVAYGPDPTWIHSAWLDSAPHRANMLSTTYTQVGVGVVEADGTLWVAQIFRTPSRAAASRSTPRKAPAPKASAAAKAAAPKAVASKAAAPKAVAKAAAPKAVARAAAPKAVAKAALPKAGPPKVATPKAGAPKAVAARTAAQAAPRAAARRVAGRVVGSAATLDIRTAPATAGTPATAAAQLQTARAALVLGLPGAEKAVRAAVDPLAAALARTTTLGARS